jgi:hypothetical protein
MIQILQYLFIILCNFNVVYHPVLLILLPAAGFLVYKNITQILYAACYGLVFYLLQYYMFMIVLGNVKQSLSFFS